MVLLLDERMFEMTAQQSEDPIKNPYTLEDDQKPYAYAVYFPDQPTVELVHDLYELTDDLTNREHQITKLYAAPQAAPAAQVDAQDAAP